MQLQQRHCVPCAAGVPALSEENEQIFIQHVPTWLLLRNNNHKLRKHFTFVDFPHAIAFVNKVAEIAEQEKHHPDILITYNKVQLDLFTHAIGGLSENDFILAAKIDMIS